MENVQNSVSNHHYFPKKQNMNLEVLFNTRRHFGR